MHIEKEKKEEEKMKPSTKESFFRSDGTVSSALKAVID